MSPAAAAIRLRNLRAYLDERAGADVVALGEAGGYQGMRWSGIAFTSERDLSAGAIPTGAAAPPAAGASRRARSCTGCWASSGRSGG